MNAEVLKQKTGERAIEFVKSGMVLGLGSGSTVFYLLRRLGERLSQGDLENIIGVPTSEGTARRAREFGIPLTTLDDHPRLDLTIDGADEVDPHLNLIKGLGGALLREKIIASVSDQLIIVADERKIVDQLGTHAPLSVEVVPFGWRIHMQYLESLGSEPTLRRTEAGEPYVTDGGHYIIDCRFTGIDDPYALTATLNSHPGVVENGLFLDLADLVIVGTPEGTKIKHATGQEKKHG